MSIRDTELMEDCEMKVRNLMHRDIKEVMKQIGFISTHISNLLDKAYITVIYVKNNDIRIEASWVGKSEKVIYSRWEDGLSNREPMVEYLAELYGENPENPLALFASILDRTCRYKNIEEIRIRKDEFLDYAEVQAKVILLTCFKDE